jgi:predicted P-loop ATPase
MPDQLFVEAVTAFKAGEHWWPDGEFEREHIAPRQASRFIVDEWERLIGDWLGTSPRDEKNQPLPLPQRCTVAEAAWRALHLGAAQLGPREQWRITAALRRLGWTRARDEKGRWWERPKVNEQCCQPSNSNAEGIQGIIRPT